MTRYRKSWTQVIKEVILNEALKPLDKSVVDAFYYKKEKAGKVVSTDGDSLWKNGLGGQEIAIWMGRKIHISAVSDVKSTEAILKYMKKSIPPGLFEEVELDEKWAVGVVYHQDFGGGEISYFRADALLKNKRWKGMGVDEYSGKQKKPRNITADEKTPGWEITPKNEIPKGLKEEVELDEASTWAGGFAKKVNADTKKQARDEKLKRMKKKQKEIKQIFIDKSAAEKAKIHFTESENNYSCDLKGIYQKENITTATMAVKQLSKLGWNIGEKNIKNGLQKVVENTQLLGRWQTLNDKPKVIIANTIKGNGVSFMQADSNIRASDYEYPYHSGALNNEEYFIVESPNWQCVAFNRKLLKKHILQDEFSRQDLWPDDIAHQFMLKGYYHLALTDLLVSHDHTLKEGINLKIDLGFLRNKNSHIRFKEKYGWHWGYRNKLLRFQFYLKLNSWFEDTSIYNDSIQKKLFNININNGPIASFKYII